MSEGFGQLQLTNLTLGKTPLDGAEETYTVLSKISTMTNLDLSFSNITTLPEGAFSIHNFIFSFLFSKGFGLLVNLTDLNMGYCVSVTSLPESESPYS